MKLPFLTGILLLALSGLAVALAFAGAGPSDTDMLAGEVEFGRFIKFYEAKVIPLSKASALADFQASISGQEKDFAEAARLKIELNTIYASRDDFAKLKRFRAGGLIKDSLLRRQLDIIHDAYLENQIDEAELKELVNQQTQIEQKFNTFRSNLDGQEFTDNQIEDILRSETDSAKLEAAWKASKTIGRVVAADIVRLAKLRNQVAKKLGFANFQQMQLALTEQDPQELEKLFDELDRLTRDLFVQLKGQVDEFLAQRLHLGVDQLQPWHYQNRFFQEAPRIFPVDLDVYYRDRDLVRLTRDFYAGIGLDIGDVIVRSDLFEKPGKYQHAFSSDIDRAGDVRVICNVKPDYYWMNTLLHEFGHAAYSKFCDRTLPWTLRDSANAFTTEAIANMFGNLAASPAWLRDMVGISQAEQEKINVASFNALRLEKLVFSRWAQVMFRFEKALYENPDQDLNRLWWDLVEKFQLLKRPQGRDEPDWASKIHIALYPAYYHNYLLGDLLACQLYSHIASQVLKAADPDNQSLVNRKEVGKYLREKVFQPGMRYGWNQMIEKATGEKLTPVHYARQFLRQR